MQGVLDASDSGQVHCQVVLVLPAWPGSAAIEMVLRLQQGHIGAFIIRTVCFGISYCIYGTGNYLGTLYVKNKEPQNR